MGQAGMTRRRMRYHAAEIDAIFDAVHGLHPCPNPDCEHFRLRMHKVLTGELPPTPWQRFRAWVTG